MDLPTNRADSGDELVQSITCPCNTWVQLAASMCVNATPLAVQSGKGCLQTGPKSTRARRGAKRRATLPGASKRMNRRSLSRQRESWCVKTDRKSTRARRGDQRRVRVEREKGHPGGAALS